MGMAEFMFLYPNAVSYRRINNPNNSAEQQRENVN